MSFAIAHALKKRSKKACHGGKMAEGGEVEASGYEAMPEEHEKENEAAMHEDADMIARIMHKRKMYSKGGMVANDDEPIAEFKPNQFDDLALRDDMESEYTGANSGDEDGNEAMDERDHDVIRKIMASRAKKGRMPHPA